MNPSLSHRLPFPAHLTARLFRALQPQPNKDRHYPAIGCGNPPPPHGPVVVWGGGNFKGVAVKERNFFSVLAQVQAAIPEWEAPLLKDLDCVEADAWYKAPEQRHACWCFLASVLQEHLGRDRPAAGTWESDVDKIMRGV